MFGLRLGFEQPIYLLMLAVLPLIWWIGWAPLRVLGPVRRWLAMGLRTILWMIVVCALAGVQWVWTSDRLTVMYILDQSESIPAIKRQFMLDYVIDSVSEHRNREREDRATPLGLRPRLALPPGRCRRHRDRQGRWRR